MNILSFVICTYLFVATNAQISCYYENNQMTYLLCTSTGNNNLLTKGVLFKKQDVVRIVLKDCQISNIDVDAFQTVRFFNVLDLSNNKLTNLTLGLFEMNTLLVELNLSNNLLTDLPKGIFNNTQLKKLFLNGNNSKIIKTDVLNILPYLFQLDLTNNHIVGNNLDTNVLPNVIQLFLSGNNMSEVNFLSRNTKLTLLVMKNCYIEVLPNFLFNETMRTLHDLDLSHNKITSINKPWSFDNLIAMQVFNLSNNLLEYIHIRAFSKLTQLKSLDLSNNRLRYVTQDMFRRNVYTLRHLDLSHNFIRNIPQNAFDQSSLRTFRLSNNNITFMYERQLLQMSTKFELSYISFGNNPWQCACLLELIRDVKLLNIAYDTEHFGDIPACVTTDEFVCMRDESVNDLFINMYKNVRT